MEEIVCDDPEREPTGADLDEVLGETSPLWDQVREKVGSAHEPVAEEWIFPAKKHGWSLRLKRGKRAIVYLSPRDGYFIAGTALGEKAIAAAHDAAYPKALLDLIDSSFRYPEGRAVRIEVRSAKDVDDVLRVTAAKMST
jgi:hypothetical protein